ncbi:hypothetical protein PPTG_19475 [Phytophthora nicotianae INRA-310]|uniref:Uncharacterized protein n=1 Tax=Phytophthora nicotianae (strain INRA-310) TaxID=761204 RepID=W2PCI4_PHYN3|nr:hypothetical protein PPTG_19475 [Phytophthora nicotianae INRA-310]ETM98551.1 hypothetical protein PPTG_19475 [Phytophthora nicotianae INRA-310]
MDDDEGNWPPMGVVASQRKASKNLPATDLVSRIASTTFAVRSNASMGSLFSELCEMVNAGATTQLIDHKEHKFMGFAKVFRRLLEKWDQLEDWFQERIDKAIPVWTSKPDHGIKYQESKGGHKSS